MRDEAVDRVLAALLAGELGADELTARHLSALVGRTTSVLYHHFGSLDGFLYAVAQGGYQRLAERVAPVAGDLGDVAERYVDFALECPVLYDLMFTRTFDWAALKASGAAAGSPGLGLWHATVAMLEARGGTADDARVLFAGLHGLASLAVSGRANVGDVGTTDRDAAVRAARHLVSLVLERP